MKILRRALQASVCFSFDSHAEQHSATNCIGLRFLHSATALVFIKLTVMAPVSEPHADHQSSYLTQ